MRTVVLLGLAAFALLAAAGCGGSGSSATGTGEAAATPAEARKAIPEVRRLLAEAVATYKAGDRDRAEQAVGDVYLERFEEVEGPLGERDQELMEALEGQISTELRGKMKAGAPDAEVDAVLRAIDGNLDKAAAALR